MPAGAALLEWLEEVRGNVQVPDAAAIRDLAIRDDSLRDLGVPRVDRGLPFDIPLEVVADGVIVGIRADVQPFDPRGIHRRARSAWAAWGGRGLVAGLWATIPVTAAVTTVAAAAHRCLVIERFSPSIGSLAGRPFYHEGVVGGGNGGCLRNVRQRI